MKIFPFASSSDGNGTLIQSAKASILIDCGVSLKALVMSVGLDIVQRLDAVFITHEHSDHIKGIGILGRKMRGLIVYINHKSCVRRPQHFVNLNTRELQASQIVKIKDLSLTPFELQHDSANAFGFFINNSSGESLTYFTDTGAVNDEIENYIKSSQMLFIESNYDEKGLLEYPDYSNVHKTRIRATHLSNTQTLDIIEKCGIENLNEIIMGHLSPRTNRPQWVKNGFFERFPDSVGKLSIAPLGLPLNP